MRRGEIWLVDLGKGTGSEQGGVRPCVIVQNDMGNKHSPTTIICPITSKQKAMLPTHVKIYNLTLPSIILCEQVMLVDKGKLLYLITEIDMKKIDVALKVSLAL